MKSIFIRVLFITLISTLLLNLIPTQVFAASPKWGRRTDGVTPIDTIVFVGARRGQSEEAAKLDPTIDLTNGFETYAPEEVPTLVSRFKSIGINQLSISTWRKYGDVETNGRGLGETIPSDQAYSDMVKEIENQGLTFMPFIEFFGDGSEGNLPLGAVLDPNLRGKVVSFFVSYVNAFGESPAWAKYYNKDGEERLGFKLIEAVLLKSNQSSSTYFNAIEDISRRVYNQTGKKIGFWLDNSLLPIDHPDGSPVKTVSMSRAKDYSSVLGSSIFNPNHINGYWENTSSYRNRRRIITDAGRNKMFDSTKSALDTLVNQGVPFHLPMTFGYDSRHIGWEEKFRYKITLNEEFYDTFISPLIRRYASKSKGFSLGLGNNTSEWQFIVPSSTSATFYEFAQNAITLYISKKGN